MEELRRERAQIASGSDPDLRRMVARLYATSSQPRLTDWPKMQLAIRRLLDTASLSGRIADHNHINLRGTG